MRSGIIFLVIINAVILGQLFLQGYGRNKRLNELEEKLDRILEKLN